MVLYLTPCGVSFIQQSKRFTLSPLSPVHRPHERRKPCAAVATGLHRCGDGVNRPKVKGQRIAGKSGCHLLGKLLPYLKVFAMLDRDNFTARAGVYPLFDGVVDWSQAQLVAHNADAGVCSRFVVKAKEFICAQGRAAFRRGWRDCAAWRVESVRRGYLRESRSRRRRVL